MGSFSYMTIAGYPTYDNKNEYYDDVANLVFLPDDYIIENRPYKAKNKLFWGDAYDNDDDTYEFNGFRQTVGTCLKRLEIYGHSFKTAQQEWSAMRANVLNQYYVADYEFPLRKVSFRAYYRELVNVISNKIINHEQLRDTLQNVLISDGLIIPGLSTANALYAILSAAPPNEIVEYELSDVIHGGWVTRDPAESIFFEKIILLTEGKTDADILSKSLKMLYPELYPYYQFMDFGGLKVEGGASALVRTVKAFAGARVSHPIIALFDNDTPGISELQKLPKQLPGNIRAMKLPDIKLAKKYPTIGPSGLKRMDVNGLACGIEIYLGSEVLSNNNIYYPIRWNNYVVEMKRYHGAFDAKNEIQKKFDHKVSLGQKWDMPEMELLFSGIFTAFHDNIMK
jgi:hypothetical protein